MGHHISAVVLSGPFDAKLAACFDLRPIPLPGGLTLFPLVARYVDSWAERLGIEGSHPGPLLNFEVVHHLIRAVAPEPLFAVIETDYFGGRGTQAAVVYRGRAEVMPPESRPSFGPINEALRLLGVSARAGSDEFDTVGLGQYRDFSGLFGASYEPLG